MTQLTPRLPRVSSSGTRPADRREQILDAAAEAFGRGGFHAVGLGDIASAVGISAPALYRHFPNKYALFAEVAHEEMARLLEAAEAVTDPGDTAAVLLAISERTVAGRHHGSLYRWEARFLTDDDRATLRATTRRLRARVSRPLQERRPGLVDRDATLLTSAALAVVASATAHHIASADLPAQLAGLAGAVLDVDLPPAPEGAAPPPPSWQHALVPTSKREQLVSEALRAFERHGYHHATLEEIGRAVGLQASGVYRYFPTKAALLTAGFARSDLQLAAVTESVLADATTASGALEALAAAYVRLWFHRPEVMSVYASELGHVPEDEREELRQSQRDHVAEWTRLVVEVVPGLDPVTARLRVHAALSIVADTGRLLRFDRRPAVRARVVTLVLAVLTRLAPELSRPSTSPNPEEYRRCCSTSPTNRPISPRRSPTSARRRSAPASSASSSPTTVDSPHSLEINAKIGAARLGRHPRPRGVRRRRRQPRRHVHPARGDDARDAADRRHRADAHRRCAPTQASAPRPRRRPCCAASSRATSQSISMSEPGAGSDVGALTCKAEKVDGGWRHQRAEDLVLQRPLRRQHPARRTHLEGRQQARGHHDVPHPGGPSRASRSAASTRSAARRSTTSTSPTASCPTTPSSARSARAGSS